MQYVFEPDTFSSRVFSPTVDIDADVKLIWSAMDPASMMYMWDEKNELAYHVEHGSVTRYVDENGTPLGGVDGSDFSSNIQLPATVEIVEKQNWFSFLMDFSYYYNVGLFTDEMLQKLAEYQRGGAILYKDAHDAMTAYLEALTE